MLSQFICWVHYLFIWISKAVYNPSMIVLCQGLLLFVRVIKPIFQADAIEWTKTDKIKDERTFFRKGNKTYIFKCSLRSVLTERHEPKGSN